MILTGTVLVCLDAMLPTEARAQSKYEVYKDTLRCLEQPLDAKQNAEQNRARNRELACRTRNMDRLVPTTPASSLPAAVCNACDKELVAMEKVRFERRKHCFISGMDAFGGEHKKLESDIRDARKICQLELLSTSWDAKNKWENGTAQSTLYSSFGSWHVEGQIKNSGELVWVLQSEDIDRRTSLELHCYSVNLGRVAYWRGPFKKVSGSDQALLVTFSIDGKSLKQVKASVYDDGKLLFATKSIQLESLVSALRATKGTLHLSGQSIAAKFAADGYLEMERDWLQRCLG
jgi:hypothetical protein